MQTNQIHFNTQLSLWLEQKKRTRALSTYIKYRRLAEHYLIPYFDSVYLSDINTHLLQNFRDSLLMPELPPHLEHGTIRCILQIANSVLRTAYESGQMEHLVYLPPCLPKKHPVVSIFSPEEQEKLEFYLNTHRGLSEAALYLCLYTGLRIGELCALRRKNIHISDRYLHVQHTAQRLTRLDTNHKSELILSAPKSASSSRLVPIPSFLIPFLIPYCPPEHPEYFFLSQSSGTPMDPRTFQNHYQHILADAGLRHLNFHAVRHTFATRCITSGIDPKTLSEILGHSDLKITLEYYFHSSLEFKKEQIDRLTVLSPAVHISLPDTLHNTMR